MKIPQSVRNLYEDLLPRYKQLNVEVDKLVMSRKEPRWHYVSRLKGDESFALKLETGRERDPRMPEDFFACTVVVENHARVADGELFVVKNFKLNHRRPKDPRRTHLEPSSFDFDDVRLYVRWMDDAAQKPTGLEGLLFEVQVKTFLQHAWGIATHDFVYKTDDIDWSSSRIAYQVKAMLENAELSIGEAAKLTGSAMLSKIDGRCLDLRAMIGEIKKRWDGAQLPKDLRRLAQTLDEMIWTLRVEFNDLWAAVDEATRAGAGARTLDLSPFGAIVAALIRKRGLDLLKPLADPRCRSAVFVPSEIDLPGLPADVAKQVIRPN